MSVMQNPSTAHTASPRSRILPLEDECFLWRMAFFYTMIYVVITTCAPGSVSKEAAAQSRGKQPTIAATAESGR